MNILDWLVSNWLIIVVLALCVLAVFLPQIYQWAMRRGGER